MYMGWFIPFVAEKEESVLSYPQNCRQENSTSGVYVYYTLSCYRLQDSLKKAETDVRVYLPLGKMQKSNIKVQNDNSKVKRGRESNFAFSSVVLSFNF